MTSDTTQLGLTATLISTTRGFYRLSIAVLPQGLTLHVGLILSLVIILVAHYVRSPWRKVPPGPKGLPILGNALQLNDKLWMFKKDCKEKFRTSNSVVADSWTRQVYDRDSSEYHVLECPRPAHDRF